MILKKISLQNYTVFDAQTIELNKGINIFIGENGTGKTHLLKLLYSACQAADKKVSFSHKIVFTMLPDDYKISRLITRKVGNSAAMVHITASENEMKKEKVLSVKFHKKTTKWDADVTGETGWEETFCDVNSIFIPAKEILSNSYNLNAAVDKNNIHFDDTYLDIINAAKIDVSVGRDTREREMMLKEIESMIHGSVVYEPKKDEFYLKKGNSKQEFNLVAEGIRKMALLWQLVKNGTLEKGSVLFWDEPEANINPKYIPIIVNILLLLQRKGVQIFISTHDYVLASYFEVHMNENDNILYHSFSFDTNLDNKIRYEAGNKFDDLENNAIIAAFNKLLDKIYNL